MQQDLEKARQLMKEAGYDGRPIVLLDSVDILPRHTSMLITQQLLTQIGVNVDLQAMDWSTVASRRAEKKPPEAGGWNLFMTQADFTDLLNPAIHMAMPGDCEKGWFG
jgi:peptide/nickel transport system substrate-binding protein